MPITGPGPLDPSLWLSVLPVTVEIRGLSMEPFLSEGDRVEVVLAAREGLQPGDLVVFRRGDETVVHRYLKGLPERFLEKGDGQTCGNWHPWPAQMGRVTAIRRGKLRSPLDSPPAAAALRRAARRHLWRHRVGRIALGLPGDLPRRMLLRLCGWFLPP
jgi:hypothetical protein